MYCKSYSSFLFLLGLVFFVVFSFYTTGLSWAQEAAWSNSLQGEQLLPPVLLVPENNAQDMPREVTLQWQDTNMAPQEAGYRVRLKAVDGLYAYYDVGMNNAEKVISDLRVNTTYCWNVKALGNGQLTSDSEWANEGEDWLFSTIYVGGDYGYVKWIFKAWADALVDTEYSLAFGADGAVYLNTGDSLYALNPADGSERWRFQAHSNSGPVIGPDGTIYMAASTRFFAIQPKDGSVKWSYRQELDYPQDLDLCNSAIGADGTVYIVSEPFWPGPGYKTLTALYPADGSVKWTHTGTNMIHLYPCPVIGNDGTIYLRSPSNNVSLCAFEPTGGALQWCLNAGPGFSNAPVIDGNGILYAGGEQAVHALDLATQEVVGYSGFLGSGFFEPFVIGDDGTVYAHGSNSLFALTPTLQTKWSLPIGEYHHSPAIGDDGTLYAVADNILYAMDSIGGNIKWTYASIGSSASSPVLGPEGTVYIVCYQLVRSDDDDPDGKATACDHCYSSEYPVYTLALYAIATESRGLADGVWPAPRGNPRRTAALDPVQLAPPILLSPANNAACQPQDIWLQWQDRNFYPREDAYRLRIKPADGQYTLYTPERDATSRFLEDLDTGRTYYWNIRALGDGKHTITSNWANQGSDWSFTTSAGSPVQLNAPVLRTPKHKHTGQERSVELEWLDTNATPQESGYCVRLKSIDRSYDYYNISTDTIETIISGLQFNKTYFWNVRTLGDGQNTLHSQWAQGNFDWKFSTKRVYTGSGKLKWKLATGNDSSNRFCPAIGPDGTIYVYNEWCNFPGLWAVDPADGTIRWNWESAHSMPQHVDDMAPVIGANGVLFVANHYQLFAIEPMNGTVLWTSNIGSSIRLHPALGSDGTIYIMGNVSIYAVDPVDGSIKWTCETPANWLPCYLFVGLDGLVYVAHSDNTLCAVDPDTGSMSWVWQPNDIHFGSAPFIGVGGIIYVVGTEDLYAVSPEDRHILWTFRAWAQFDSSGVVGQDGTVYIGSLDNNVYAIDSGTGKVIWTTKLQGQICTSPALGADGTLMVSAKNGLLYALDTVDGHIKWTCDTGVSLATSPVIGPDGVVYVNYSYLNLFAIISDCGGLADSPWPMVHHDARHTGRAGSSTR